MRMFRFGLLVLVTLSASVLADPPPKLKGKKTEGAPKIDLGLPPPAPLPTDQKLESATKKDEPQQGPTAVRADEGYTVVRVAHGKAFIRTPEGAKPSAPYPHVTVNGPPYQMEKFATVVRVRCAAKKNARIEVLVLDQRSDTLMEASGELRFGNNEETEWQVDWEPTGLRNPGELQVLVRVGGNPLGTTPLTAVLATPPTPK